MNTFGTLFRVHIFGESHGPAVGVTIDGCPAGIQLTHSDFTSDLARRKSGAPGTTKRTEPDEPEILSGIKDGKTTGAPLTIIVRNTDTRHSDYEKFSRIPRPGHADFTASVKYKGFSDLRGSGHFSGRLTLGLVIAGVIAKKLLAGITIKGELIEVGGSKDIENTVSMAVADNDSVGGLIECRVAGVSSGLGEPFFDSAESLISHIVFAIPGIRGIEFGDGFKAAQMKGSEHNDLFTGTSGKTATNHAGGINGGITNGSEIIFRVAVKPTASIAKPQKTFDMVTGKIEELTIGGRHDACIALRMPVIIEAVTAIVLADLKGRQQWS